MRTVVVAVAGCAVLGLCASSALGQTRGTAAYVARLVPDMCGSSPCNAARISFERGEIHIPKLKAADLVFNSSIGRIVLQNVIPPQPGLQARVTATLSYGSDRDLDCPHANSRVTLSPWATSSLVCPPPVFGFYTPCRGELRVAALTPPECAGVDVVVEDISVDVYQDGFAGDPTRRIAHDGIATGGQSPDCNSGGTGGCP